MKGYIVHGNHTTAQVSAEFLEVFEEHTGRPFPEDPYEQLEIAIASQDLDITEEIEAEIDSLHQIHGNPCP